MSKKALVIGNDAYTSCPLAGCCNDAMEVEALLKINADGSPNFSVASLLNADSTEIKRAIHALFEGRNEIAILYFAGHGTSEEFESGIVGIDNATVSFDYIMSKVRKSQHRHNILIFDSCFSGGAGHSFCCGEDTVALPSGVTIMSACRKSETASEQHGHGLFTSLLSDALNGGASNLIGDITPGAVYAYIDRCLGPWDQRPVFKTHVDSFCSIRKTNPPISLSILRKLPELFPTPVSTISLNPSFEKTNTPAIDHKVIEPHADCDNVAIFQDLQRLAHVGLVIPHGADHMYIAAMESKGCKLTPLGEHYWELASQKKI
ncbi:MAG: caspase family protein [Akkermansia sp.]|nr:caspase family protein [Akkermansia sp.]